MGIFSNSSPFDQDVERATSENNTSEEWGLIMEICDRAGASPQAAKECLRATMRRLAHADPHVQCHAATLLDACVNNCGRAFHLEVASRDFEHEFRRVYWRAQPPVQRRLRALLRKWAEGEFRTDPALDLIPSLHAKLRAEAAPGGGRASPAPSAAAAPAHAAAPAAAAAAREQDELARAIALSLRDAPPAAAATAAAPAAALYPRVEAPAPAEAAREARRVRALYDFEAAEDNELTFMAGEIVHVTDSSDPNWWKGYNSRGEGLFPANFVSADEAAAAAAAAPAPAPAEEAAAEDEPAAAAVSAIDEGAMDLCLGALHEADPAAAGGVREEAALARLEARALACGALVDAALERADTRHARLTQLSAELVDALNLYHELMRPPPAPPAPLAPPAPFAAPRPFHHQQMPR